MKGHNFNDQSLNNSTKKNFFDKELIPLGDDKNSPIRKFKKQNTLI